MHTLAVYAANLTLGLGIAVCVWALIQAFRNALDRPDWLLIAVISATMLWCLTILVGLNA